MASVSLQCGYKLIGYYLSEKLHLTFTLPVLRLLSFCFLEHPFKRLWGLYFWRSHIQIQLINMFLKCVVSSEVKERHFEKDLEKLVIKKYADI